MSRTPTPSLSDSMTSTTLNPDTMAATQLLALPLRLSEEQRRALVAMQDRDVIWLETRLAHISALGVVENPSAASLVLDHYGLAQ